MLLACRLTSLCVVSMLASYVAAEGDDVDFPPTVAPSVGKPWPLPQKYKSSPDILSLSDVVFRFNVVGSSSDILEDALDRYFKLIFYAGRGGPLPAIDSLAGGYRAVAVLQSLDVKIIQPCDDYPHLYMDETYNLSVSTSGRAALSSPNIWGALRGLETFTHLVWEAANGQFVINSTEIQDFPRFAWRGAMLDSARHFLPKAVLLESLDAMAYNKLNVLHWHMVDDQSFPYQSLAFPNLSQKGAYEPYTHVYSQDDMREIVEFARMRGIRVMPEFDTPGHALAWGKGQPDLLTKCCDKQGKFDGTFGPMDPTKNSTFGFLHDLMQEVTSIFPDSYLHLGGDEVRFGCWESNPVVKSFAQKMGFGKDFAKLQGYFVGRLQNTLRPLKRKYVMWQEVVDHKAKITPDTVVHVWKFKTIPGELERVTKLGYTTLLSANWYLSKIQMGQDWARFYKNDPHHFNGSAAQKKLVIGGELCMWGEYADATNVIAKVWPRGSAVAERLWSPEHVTDLTDAKARMEEQRCRMLRRGLSAEPINGPGFCRYEYEAGDQE